MKAFTDLYTALDETTKTNEKIAAMKKYFEHARAADAAWAVYFLTGRKPKQIVPTNKLVAWSIEEAQITDWLFADSYDTVGDLAETIALLLPEKKEPGDIPLAELVEGRLLPLRKQSEEIQHDTIIALWRELNESQRFILNKLITGAFRVGVSQQLVIRALSAVSGNETTQVAHRLMGAWEPSAQFYEQLISKEHDDSDISRPYPFYLAYPLEEEPAYLGGIQEWQAEWKWDGIRAQLMRRNGEFFIWSRGEELVTDRYPELVEDAHLLPDGTVLDGEILGWREVNVLPFSQLQLRIGRKTVSKKLLEEVPVILMSYDLLEIEGRDIRAQPLQERRDLMTRLLRGLETSFRPSSNGSGPGSGPGPESGSESKSDPAPTCQRLSTRLRISPTVDANSWEELTKMREDSRSLNVEGLMLKRRSSVYGVGRQRGDWWKWKVNPFTIDAVLIYAQRGSGKRASLYTDYTFGVWNEGKLVPVAKAYSGLTDEEIRKVDLFVRQNTLEKFGPVRTVKPELVFELAFEGINRSTRHKSGVAVRFPRMARWRIDKPMEEADTLDTLKALLTD